MTTTHDAVPRPYQVDIAIRRAIAAECAGLVFLGDFPLAETSRALAERGGLPVLMSTATPSELAVLMDRTIRGGAEEVLSRAEYAIARATRAAATAQGRPTEAVLEDVGAALGVRLSLVQDTGVTWSNPTRSAWARCRSGG